MRIALAVLMALHGVAHMVGFAGSGMLNEMPVPQAKKSFTFTRPTIAATITKIRTSRQIISFSSQGSLDHRPP